MRLILCCKSQLCGARKSRPPNRLLTSCRGQPGLGGWGRQFKISGARMTGVVLVMLLAAPESLRKGRTEDTPTIVPVVWLPRRKPSPLIIQFAALGPSNSSVSCSARGPVSLLPLDPGESPHLDCHRSQLWLIPAAAEGENCHWVRAAGPMDSFPAQSHKPL